MRLVVVTSEPGWAEGLRAVFSPNDMVMSTDLAQAQGNPPLLSAADACFIAEANTSTWTVDAVRQLSSLTDVPLFVLTDSNRSQWEEAALFAGAQQVLRRPLRPGVIQLAISRCARSRPVDNGQLGSAPRAVQPLESTATPLGQWAAFTGLLAKSGGGAAAIDDYLRLLRDALRCNRLLVYVPDAAGGPGTYRCGYAKGVEPRDFAGFRLSARNGIMQWVLERGTVAWRQRLRPESARDASAFRELKVFGAELAVPVPAALGPAGLLLVGPRISGADYSEEDAIALFATMEQFAPLLSSVSSLTTQRSDVGRVLPLLDAMPMACALVTGGLKVLNANRAFLTLLETPRRTDEVTLADLPQAWSAAISAAVQNGAESARVDLEHRTAASSGIVRLSIRRLVGSEADGGTSFLVSVTDTVPGRLVPEAENETSGIQNLLQRAGEQLSNEFGNALTPLDILVQMVRQPSTSRSELEQLGTQVAVGMHRLRRRVDDLSYLTKDAIIPEPTTVSSILRFTRERLEEWLEHRQLKRVVWLNEFSEAPLVADGRALALAIAELVMNAVEACEGRQVTVTAEDTVDGASFRVRNFGAWSPSADAGGKRHRPFVSTKSNGVGLGIEVATRVAANHGGNLQVGPISSDTVEAVLTIAKQARPAAKPQSRISADLPIRVSQVTEL